MVCTRQLAADLLEHTYTNHMLSLFSQVVWGTLFLNCLPTRPGTAQQQHHTWETALAPAVAAVAAAMQGLQLLFVCWGSGDMVEELVQVGSKQKPRGAQRDCSA